MSALVIAFDTNMIGWPFCVRHAAICCCEASVVRVASALGSYGFISGADVSSFLSNSKAFWHLLVQINFRSPLRSSLKGFIFVAKFGIIRPKKLINPMNDAIYLLLLGASSRDTFEMRVSFGRIPSADSLKPKKVTELEHE